MKIESVDAFYLRMPEVKAIGDGSQDALLIRVRAGGFEGWGECEAAPLPTIAALIAPMSHSACRPVLDSVIGAELDGPDSISKIHREVKFKGMDLLQTDHALSGIDIALWDLLGKREQAPVWSLLGKQNLPKTAYASVLFGATPGETFGIARKIGMSRFRAVKFGWGPIGKGSPDDDFIQLSAITETLRGSKVDTTFVDTGCVFGHDVQRAMERIEVFENRRIGWWEEPFANGALAEYAELAGRTKIPLAAGEGAHNTDQAKHLIDYGRVGIVQIDTGRVGGISAAREVAVYACLKNVPFVNHTFTSNLALSASLQPYADAEGYAEVPIDTSAVARAIGGDPWQPDENGLISAPDAPGLGVTPDLERLKPYLQELEIVWNGVPIWRNQSPI